MKPSVFSILNNFKIIVRNYYASIYNILKQDFPYWGDTFVVSLIFCIFLVRILKTNIFLAGYVTYIDILIVRFACNIHIYKSNLSVNRWKRVLHTCLRRISSTCRIECRNNSCGLNFRRRRRANITQKKLTSLKYILELSNNREIC